MYEIYTLLLHRRSAHKGPGHHGQRPEGKHLPRSRADPRDSPGGGSGEPEVAARVGVTSNVTMGPLPAHRVRENERELQAVAEAFLAALQREARAKPGLFDVMALHIGRSPCDKLGESAPAEHAYWAGKGRRYFVDVPVNLVYHALGVVMEWYMRRQVRRDLREVG